MKKKIYKIISLLLCFLFFIEQTGFAQVAPELNIAGQIAQMRNNFVLDKFRPLHLRYVAYSPRDNTFQLLLDKGNNKNFSNTFLTDSTQTLLNYFLIGVTLPNDSFWVNLRPDAPDRIIDDKLAMTDVGRILLAADLQLKKDAAGATSPATPEGRVYWNKLYQRAEEIYGSNNVMIPTVTRPWIVPDEIIVREAGDSAYIYKATLKVMLEQDYIKDSPLYKFDDPKTKELNDYAASLMRELIIPKLTREINTSKRYADLRQVYYSLILAQWFKQQFNAGQGKYTQLIDRRDLTGLTSKDAWSKDTYFNAYKKSFAQGEYNLEETVNSIYGQTARTYISGGVLLSGITQAINAGRIRVRAAGANLAQRFLGRVVGLKVGPTGITVDPETVTAAAKAEDQGIPADQSSVSQQAAAITQVNGEEILKQARATLYQVLGGKAMPLALALAMQGKDLDTVFESYDQEFGVIVVDDAVMPILARTVGMETGAAFNLKGNIVVDKSTLEKAKKGDKDALSNIQHEKSHNDYRAAHPGMTTDVAQSLVDELYAHFAAFVDVYGAGAIAEERNSGLGRMQWTQIVANVLIKEYINGFYKNQIKDKKAIEELSIKVAIAAYLIGEGIRLGATDRVLAYLKQAESLDQLLAGTTRENIDKLVKFYADFFKQQNAGWEVSEINIDNFDSLRQKYLDFRAAYEAQHPQATPSPAAPAPQAQIASVSANRTTSTLKTKITSSLVAMLMLILSPFASAGLNEKAADTAKAQDTYAAESASPTAPSNVFVADGEKIIPGPETNPADNNVAMPQSGTISTTKHNYNDPEFQRVAQYILKHAPADLLELLQNSYKGIRGGGGVNSRVALEQYLEKNYKKGEGHFIPVKGLLAATGYKIFYDNNLGFSKLFVDADFFDTAEGKAQVQAAQDTALHNNRMELLKIFGAFLLSIPVLMLGIVSIYFATFSVKLIPKFLLSRQSRPQLFSGPERTVLSFETLGGYEMRIKEDGKVSLIDREGNEPNPWSQLRSHDWHQDGRPRIERIRDLMISLAARSLLNREQYATFKRISAGARQRFLAFDSLPMRIALIDMLAAGENIATVDDFLERTVFYRHWGFHYSSDYWNALAAAFESVLAFTDNRTQMRMRISLGEIFASSGMQSMRGLPVRVMRRLAGLNFDKLTDYLPYLIQALAEEHLATNDAQEKRDIDRILKNIMSWQTLGEFNGKLVNSLRFERAGAEGMVDKLVELVISSPNSRAMSDFLAPYLCELRYFASVLGRLQQLDSPRINLFIAMKEAAFPGAKHQRLDAFGKLTREQKEAIRNTGLPYAREFVDALDAWLRETGSEEAVYQALLQLIVNVDYHNIGMLSFLKMLLYEFRGQIKYFEGFPDDKFADLMAELIKTPVLVEKKAGESTLSSDYVTTVALHLYLKNNPQNALKIAARIHEGIKNSEEQRNAFLEKMMAAPSAQETPSLEILLTLFNPALLKYQKAVEQLFKDLSPVSSFRDVAKVLLMGQLNDAIINSVTEDGALDFYVFLNKADKDKELSGSFKSLIIDIAPQLIENFVRMETGEWQKYGKDIGQLGLLYGLSVDEMFKLMAFLKLIEKINPQHKLTHDNVAKYAKVANGPRAQDTIVFISDLKQYGYTYRSNDLDLLEGMSVRGAQIIADIEEIRKAYPDFRFTYHLDQDAGTGRYITDPYQMFVNQLGIEHAYKVNKHIFMNAKILRGAIALLLNGLPLGFEVRYSDMVYTLLAAESDIDKRADMLKFLHQRRRDITDAFEFLLNNSIDCEDAFIETFFKKRDIALLDLLVELEEMWGDMSKEAQAMAKDILTGLKGKRYESIRDGLGLFVQAYAVTQGAKLSEKGLLASVGQARDAYAKGEIGNKQFLSTMENIFAAQVRQALKGVLGEDVPQDFQDFLKAQPQMMRNLGTLIGVYFRIHDDYPDTCAKIQAVLRQVTKFKDVAALNDWLYTQSEWNKPVYDDLTKDKPMPDGSTRKAPYNEKLWLEGFSKTVPAEPAGKDENKLRLQTEQLIAFAREHELDADPEMINLDTYDEAVKYAEAYILKNPKVSEADKDNTRRILEETKKLEEEYHKKYSPTSVRVEVAFDFFKDAASGVGVPGCYNPVTGSNKQMPLMHALETDALFLRVYRGDDVIANAVLVLTPQGVVVHPLYTSKNLDLDGAVFDALAELVLRGWVPKVMMTPNSAGFGVAKVFAKSENNDAGKAKILADGYYFDFGGVSGFTTNYAFDQATLKDSDYQPVKEIKDIAPERKRVNPTVAADETSLTKEERGDISKQLFTLKLNIDLKPILSNIDKIIFEYSEEQIEEMLSALTTRSPPQGKPSADDIEKLRSKLRGFIGNLSEPVPDVEEAEPATYAAKGADVAFEGGADNVGQQAFGDAWAQAEQIPTSQEHLRVLQDPAMGKDFIVPQVRLISRQEMDALNGSAGRNVIRQGGQVLIAADHWNTRSEDEKLDILMHEGMADWMERMHPDQAAEDIAIDLEGVRVNEQARRDAHKGVSRDISMDGKINPLQQRILSAAGIPANAVFSIAPYQNLHGTDLQQRLAQDLSARRENSLAISGLEDVVRNGSDYAPLTIILASIFDRIAASAHNQDIADPHWRDALEEVISNAIIWGNRAREGSLVILRWGEENGKLWIEVVDEGATSYNPETIQDPPSGINSLYYGAGSGRYVFERYLAPGYVRTVRGKPIFGKPVAENLNQGKVLRFEFFIGAQKAPAIRTSLAGRLSTWIALLGLGGLAANLASAAEAAHNTGLIEQASGNPIAFILGAAVVGVAALGTWLSVKWFRKSAVNLITDTNTMSDAEVVQTTVDLLRVSSRAFNTRYFLRDADDSIKNDPFYKAIKENRAVIAKNRDGKVIGGLLFGAPGENRISLMIVDPASQRDGIGSRLMDAAVERFRANGVDKFSLGVELIKRIPDPGRELAQDEVKVELNDMMPLPFYRTYFARTTLNSQESWVRVDKPFRSTLDRDAGKVLLRASKEIEVIIPVADAPQTFVSAMNSAVAPILSERGITGQLPTQLAKQIYAGMDGVVEEEMVLNISKVVRVSAIRFEKVSATVDVKNRTVTIPTGDKKLSFAIADTCKPGETKIRDLEIMVVRGGVKTRVNFLEALVDFGFAPRGIIDNSFAAEHPFEIVQNTASGNLRIIWGTEEKEFEFDPLTGDWIALRSRPNTRTWQNNHLLPKDMRSDEELVLSGHNHGVRPEGETVLPSPEDIIGEAEMAQLEWENNFASKDAIARHRPMMSGSRIDAIISARKGIEQKIELEELIIGTIKDAGHGFAKIKFLIVPGRITCTVQVFNFQAQKWEDLVVLFDGEPELVTGMTPEDIRAKIEQAKEKINTSALTSAKASSHVTRPRLLSRVSTWVAVFALGAVFPSVALGAVPLLLAQAAANPFVFVIGAALIGAVALSGMADGPGENIQPIPQVLRDRVARLEGEVSKRSAGGVVMPVNMANPRLDRLGIPEAVRRGEALRLDFSGLRAEQREDYRKIRDAIIDLVRLLDQASKDRFLEGRVRRVAEEMIKNAVAHGNGVNTALPVFVLLDIENGVLEVYDTHNDLPETQAERAKQMKESKFILQGQDQGRERISMALPDGEQLDLLPAGTTGGTLARVQLRPRREAQPLDLGREVAVASVPMPAYTWGPGRMTGPMLDWFRAIKEKILLTCRQNNIDMPLDGHNLDDLIGNLIDAVLKRLDNEYESLDESEQFFFDGKGEITFKIFKDDATGKISFVFSNDGLPVSPSIMQGWVEGRFESTTAAINPTEAPRYFGGKGVGMRGILGDIARKKSEAMLLTRQADESSARLFRQNASGRREVLMNVPKQSPGTDLIITLPRQESAVTPQAPATLNPQPQETPKAPGGIDFRGMPIVTQQMAGAGLNFKTPQFNNANLDSEIANMRGMINAGIIPSCDRLKEYLIASCAKEDCKEKLENALTCIADILRIEEDRVEPTDPAIREFLVLLESGSSASQMQIALAKVQVSPKEPELIVQ